MSLDAQKSFAQIRQDYIDNPKVGTFNALICGEAGTGKTKLLETCRKPVLAHFFDPGGEITLREMIPKGELLPEIFAPDDPFKPWAFTSWAKILDQEIKSGLFEHIGTYALDSSTLWAESILNYLTAKRGMAGKTPDGKVDYMPQKTEIRNWITRILSLPCDVIVTGHLEPTQDQVSGRLTYRYATTGKGTIMIPALFDEIYVREAEDTSKGVSYKLRTAGAGRYMARSRLASGGKLDTFEEPDIKNILKKVGYPTDDKPLFIQP